MKINFEKKIDIVIEELFFSTKPSSESTPYSTLLSVFDKF